MFIDQLATQPISSRAALTEAKAYQPALPREDLGGKFPAIFARHRTLHALDDGCAEATVILELLGAIVDFDARFAADEFVVGAFVRVLETAPAAHVVDQYGLEVG